MRCACAAFGYDGRSNLKGPQMRTLLKTLPLLAALVAGPALAAGKGASGASGAPVANPPTPAPTAAPTSAPASAATQKRQTCPTADQAKNGATGGAIGYASYDKAMRQRCTSLALPQASPTSEESRDRAPQNETRTPHQY
jgi:hypothetical protein